MVDGEQKVTGFLEQTTLLLRQLDKSAILSAEQILLECYHRHGRVYTLGNGGSAATAQHFACDLAKYVVPPGAPPFDVRCLTDNVALYTAWANDAARQDVFVNLLRGLLEPEDVLLAISVHGGTGFSTDLVRAVRFAKQVGAATICLVGFAGGPLHRECTCSIRVPSESTPQTEAIHLVIQHLLVCMIREALASDSRQLAGGDGQVAADVEQQS
jgi:D-sedoheptulose 7-phosphate isomerase